MTFTPVVRVKRTYLDLLALSQLTDRLVDWTLRLTSFQSLPRLNIHVATTLSWAISEGGFSIVRVSADALRGLEDEVPGAPRRAIELNPGPGRDPLVALAVEV